MMSQKDAVVNAVIAIKSNFVIGKDIALNMLSNDELERIKDSIASGIMNKTISYGKDSNNYLEVRTYSRSVVMNHLKKAKELNGGIYTIRSNNTINAPTSINIKANNTKISGIEMSVLPEDLANMIRQIV